jgi:hypothetical protein
MPANSNKPSKPAQSGFSKKKHFFSLAVTIDEKSDPFYSEYIVLSKTVDAVNSFHSLYANLRVGRSGPSTHEQQDLYRAMLVFACAGLDVFVKQLVKKKIPQLVDRDASAKEKFLAYVKKGLNHEDKKILNTLALALVHQSPREVLISEYVDSLSGDSLQSVDELHRVAAASGLNCTLIFTNEKRNFLKDAFKVRNEIVHEMDINIDDLEKVVKTTGYRTRRQRVATEMEKHTRTILDLACELLDEYRKKYLSLAIGIKKSETIPTIR